ASAGGPDEAGYAGLYGVDQNGGDAVGSEVEREWVSVVIPEFQREAFGLRSGIDEDRRGAPACADCDVRDGAGGAGYGGVNGQRDWDDQGTIAFACGGDGDVSCVRARAQAGKSARNKGNREYSRRGRGWAGRAVLGNGFPNESWS